MSHQFGQLGTDLMIVPSDQNSYIQRLTNTD